MIRMQEFMQSNTSKNFILFFFTEIPNFTFKPSKLKKDQRMMSLIKISLLTGPKRKHDSKNSAGRSVRRKQCLECFHEEN